MATEQKETLNSYEEFGLFGFLISNKDKFPSLHATVESLTLNTATLFAPQTLNSLDAEIARNPNIVFESYLLLDAVNVFCVQTSRRFDEVMSSLIENAVFIRTVPNEGLVISEQVLDHFIFTEAEGAKSLLESNKTLLALYIYTLIYSLF